MAEIKPGDTVMCILPPAVDRHDRPAQRPKIGERYVVRETYDAHYGRGARLEDLDPFPYEGYVLWARDSNSLNVAGGWYFVKVKSFSDSLPSK